jgi:hypothetical protein
MEELRSATFEPMHRSPPRPQRSTTLAVDQSLTRVDPAQYAGLRLSYRLRPQHTASLRSMQYDDDSMQYDIGSTRRPSFPIRTELTSQRL